MKPPYQPPITTPASWPVEKTATARERLSGACASAVSVTAEGKKIDSATPIRPRQARSAPAEEDAPVSAVTALQSTRLATIRVRREKRSPSSPASGEQSA